MHNPRTYARVVALVTAIKFDLMTCINDTTTCHRSHRVTYLSCDVWSSTIGECPPLENDYAIKRAGRLQYTLLCSYCSRRERRIPGLTGNRFCHQTFLRVNVS